MARIGLSRMCLFADPERVPGAGIALRLSGLRGEKPRGGSERDDIQRAPQPADRRGGGILFVLPAADHC